MAVFKRSSSFRRQNFSFLAIRHIEELKSSRRTEPIEIGIRVALGHRTGRFYG